MDPRRKKKYRNEDEREADLPKASPAELARQRARMGRANAGKPGDIDLRKSIKPRPIAAARDDADVRKKRKPSSDPRTVSSIVDDPAGTSGDFAPRVDRLQAALTPKKKPAVSADDSAIHAFMNDVRAGDGAGATRRFQLYTEQNVGRKKRKP